MAGEFLIEALEPRQLLSSSPTAAPPSAAPAAATVSATASVTVAGSSTTSTASSSASAATSSTATATTTSTTTTDSGKKPAFVRPGQTSSTQTSSSGQVSSIPWGTDIYPPPIFTGTGSHGTPRTTVLVGPAAPTSLTTQSTSSTTPTAPVTPIVIGPRRGTSGASVAKHFVVRRDDVVDHSGHASSVVIGPDIVTSATPRTPHTTPAIFADAPHPTTALTQTSSAIVSIASESSAFHGISLADWGPYLAPPSSTPAAGIRSLPAKASSGAPAQHLTALPDSTDHSSANAHIMRSRSAAGLAGLLLPLATMDTDILPTGDTGVSKLEVNVALGSLAVVIAGYWYLCDAAARRRRQQATAVSVFCDKPVE